MTLSPDAERHDEETRDMTQWADMTEAEREAANPQRFQPDAERQRLEGLLTDELLETVAFEVRAFSRGSERIPRAREVLVSALLCAQPNVVPIRQPVNPDIQARLKAWIRSKGAGGCRLLSKGEACTCPLCDVDDLCAEILRMATLLADPPDPAPGTWHQVALRVGEELASVGPDGYYTFTPEQWRDWALKVLEGPRLRKELGEPRMYSDMAGNWMRGVLIAEPNDQLAPDPAPGLREALIVRLREAQQNWADAEKAAAGFSWKATAADAAKQRDLMAEAADYIERAARPADTPTQKQARLNFDVLATVCEHYNAIESVSEDYDEGRKDALGDIIATFESDAPLLPAVAPAPSGWQPIETAPKTSRHILVWTPANKCTSLVAWDTEQGWTHGFCNHRLIDTPTHWQPLPLPPASTARDDA